MWRSAAFFGTVDSVEFTGHTAGACITLQREVATVKYNAFAACKLQHQRRCFNLRRLKAFCSAVDFCQHRPEFTCCIDTCLRIGNIFFSQMLAQKLYKVLFGLQHCFFSADKLRFFHPYIRILYAYRFLRTQPCSIAVTAQVTKHCDQSMLICTAAKLFVVNPCIMHNTCFLVRFPFLQSICKLLLITFKHRAFHICAMVDFVVKLPSKITFRPIIHHQEEVISIAQRSHEVFRPFDNSLTQALFAVAANLRLILYRQFLQVCYRISLNLFKSFTGGNLIHLRILLCNSTNVFQCVDNVHIVRKAKLRRIGQIIIRVQNKLRHRNNFVTVLCLHLCNVIAKRLHFSAVGVKVLAVIAHALQQCAHLEEVLLCSPYFFLAVHLLSDVLSCAFNLMFGLDCFTI